MPLKVHPHIYDAVWVEGTHFGVDHYLIFALIQRESDFIPLAVGDNGRSFGLMQVNLDGAGAGHEPAELLDIDRNVQIGVRYLRGCLDAFPDNLSEGIAAYRQGVQGVKDRGWAGSMEYVADILSEAERYRAQGVQRYGPFTSWARWERT